MNEVLNTIFNRKSVRKFTGEFVNEHLLDVLVKAGMAAPSAKNIQPWYFIVVTDRQKIDYLCNELPYAKMLKTAFAAIIVCGISEEDEIKGSSFWVQDCSAATQNILLAAEALGLGAVWTAAYPYKDRMEPVKIACNLPDDVYALSVIPIGIPVGNEVSKNKFNKERIVKNSF